MRRLVASLAAVLPILAAFACGGRTDGLGGGENCPQGASCAPVCALTGSEAPGGSCDYATQAGCSFNTTVAACGATYTTSCTCQPNNAGSGTWACPTGPLPDCVDAQPPPTCPEPAAIQSGGVCAVSSTLSCQSQIPIYGCSGQLEGYLSCFCENGGWSCPQPHAPDCPDVSPPPPPCPDPKAVAQGGSCFSEGQQCPGRPTLCGGQILYDAFQCTSGQWDDIATTICDVDAAGGDQ